jgi:hypothetical protein
MKSLSWQAVALACAMILGFCVIFVFSDTTGRTTLIGIVTTGLTGYLAIVLTRMRNELEDVKRHVNGNTTKLIDKIPDAERPADIPLLETRDAK